MREFWFKPSLFLCPFVLTWASIGVGSAAAKDFASPTPVSPIRMLIPNHAYSLEAHPVLAGLIEDYNRQHPQAPVSLIRRGEEYSSIRELIATQLAGSIPEIGTVEYTESLALSELKIQQELPFMRTIPIVLVNEEAISRSPSRRLAKNWPITWEELLETANSLAQNPRIYALALPLQGARGLWFFEALARKPLWHRTAGGLRANRELSSTIQMLQKLLDRPKFIRPDLNLDRAVQDFLDEKSPLLVASLDLLPYIAKQASFAWRATPLPCPGTNSACRLQEGSNFIITRAAPAAREFLSYWNSPEIAARWVAALSVLPSPSLASSKIWEARKSSRIPQYNDLLTRLPSIRVLENRSTDQDVVRARSAWVRALPLFFGISSKRLTSESTFLELDRALNQNK